MLGLSSSERAKGIVCGREQSCDTCAEGHDSEWMEGMAVRRLRDDLREITGRREDLPISGFHLGKTRTRRRANNCNFAARYV
jgi:hypothetical protein